MSIFGKVAWKGSAMLASIQKATEAGLDRAAIIVVNDVVNHFGSPPPEPDKKGGFKKNSSKKWKRGHPSAPGDPPNIQTGALMRSIAFDKGKGPMQRRVGSTFKPSVGGQGKRTYANVLEYGGQYIEARPYLRPAVARCKAQIIAAIRGSIKGAVFK